MAERVGFEPTVRLPVQRFSSSMILMLAGAVQCLSVCAGLAFLMRSSRLVVPRAMLCRVVRLQIRLQTLLTSPCPLLGLNRIFLIRTLMSANDQRGHSQGQHTEALLPPRSSRGVRSEGLPAHLGT